MTAWDELISKSTLPDNSVIDAWEHLTSTLPPSGSGETIYRTVDLTFEIDSNPELNFNIDYYPSMEFNLIGSSFAFEISSTQLTYELRTTELEFELEN